MCSIPPTDQAPTTVFQYISTSSTQFLKTLLSFDSMKSSSSLSFIIIVLNKFFLAVICPVQSFALIVEKDKNWHIIFKESLPYLER